jgi:putative two-component system response regulator
MVEALRGLPGIDIDTSLDSRRVEEMCRKTQYDTLVVDYMMPGVDGIALVRTLREQENYRTVPIVMVTSKLDREVRVEALSAGATDFLTKPFDRLELQARVSNLLSLRRAQVRLSCWAEELNGTVKRAIQTVARREEEMIWRLARAMEMRDDDTGHHISRVAEISRTLARGLGHDEHWCHMVYLAAPLHDVGKIGVTDSILRKPGRLDEDELVEMRRHVEHGNRILQGGSSELLQVAANIARHHHEKWDGSGYPDGLVGEAIPLEARIVAVADVFDALCSKRPYKPAWPRETAVSEILRGAGRHFDPGCVEAFIRLLPEIEEIMTRLRDEPTDRPTIAAPITPEADRDPVTTVVALGRRVAR